MVGIETDFDRIKFNYKNINLIVYDFDGVMTDNRVIIFQDGTEAVIVNRADGLGVDRFRSLGIPQLILSTETNPVVKARAAKLHLEVIASCKNKKIALENYCTQKGYDSNKVMYIGNDLNDLEVMKIVGFPVAPADAHPKIKKIAKLITEAKGGEGVVKEVSDYMMASQRLSQVEECGTRTLHNSLGSYKYTKNPTVPEIGIYLEILNHMAINIFGKVSICVRFDPKGLGIIGDAAVDSLLDIWNGPKRKEWSKYHIQGRRDKILLCSYCDFWGVPKELDNWRIKKNGKS